MSISTSYGQLWLPNILSDNMVLQQNSKVKLWGKATPNSSVSIAVEWSKDAISIEAKNDGTWETVIKTTQAGGPYSISITNNSDKKVLNNILLGEVWICAGQSNMEMPLKGFNSQPVNNALETIVESEQFNIIRMFTANKTIASEKKNDVNGDWKVASVTTTTNFSAIAYFYARELYKTLKVPIGVIHISWGGSNVQAWMSAESLKMFPELVNLPIDMNSKSPMRIPAALYNGMFNPIKNYGVKGIIWYQGESNINEPELYKKIFPAMVNEWRDNIGLGNIPFYYVQIAPYRYDGSNNVKSALLREVQLQCVDLIPNTGMVVTMDIGSESLIHPAEKLTIGQRLSYISLAKTYGYNGLHWISPIYKEKEIVQNKIVLTFHNEANGFTPLHAGIQGFEIAGEDGVFYPAQAKIKSPKQIEVWSDSVVNPTRATYCFKNFAIGTLKDSFGLPVSSFRTDK